MFRHTILVAAAVAGLVLALAGPAQAASYWWDGGGADDLWTNTANWDTNSSGTGGNPVAAPGLGDYAYFLNLVAGGNVDTTGFTSPGTTGKLYVQNTADVTCPRSLVQGL